MSDPEASKICSPSRPRRATRAKLLMLANNRAAVIRASNWRCPRPRVDDLAGTVVSDDERQHAPRAADE
jgi:hypothetical protein